MRETIPPLPAYVFMAWCSVKAQGLHFIIIIIIIIIVIIMIIFTSLLTSLSLLNALEIGHIFEGITHACRKRRLKWVATLPLGYISTEAWSTGMGVGRGVNNPTL
jgi:hypothetical protein